MSERCDVLLLAAFPPELAALKATLGEGLRAVVAGRDVAARTVGIGLATAAAGAAMRVAEVRPRAVVLLGTCGAYMGDAAPENTNQVIQNDPKPGAIDPKYANQVIQNLDVAVARNVRLVEPAVLESRAAFPDIMPLSVPADPALTAAFAPHAHLADIATTLAVTTDDTLAALLATAGDVEHLEAYGVAAACAAAQIPFTAVLGVANAVGSVGRAQWRANHHAASAAAIAVVTAWLERGAPGVTR